MEDKLVTLAILTYAKAQCVTLQHINVHLVFN